MQSLNPAQSFFVWSITGGTLAGVIFRPRPWPEAVWACLGATLLVLCRLVSPDTAFHAAAKGADVYFFLTGMMLLAEMARREGVFDWLATLAVRASRRSPTRLFALVYAVGILVTVFLSNDATAVVLTPAVYAAVRKARADALTYLLICAFIANAASFVLPISNPANLVVYRTSLPPLLAWLRAFVLPSVCSIAATYAMLRWILRGELRAEVHFPPDPAALSRKGRNAAWGLIASAAVLLTASGLGIDLGLPTCVVAAVSVLIAVGWRESLPIARGVSWSVLPLVAGLFVLVEALNRSGCLVATLYLFHQCSALPHWAGALAASFGIAALSNVLNNLPSGLLAAGALQAAHFPPSIRDSVLIGVDLGPNLSVTGSLATILWLIALRREGIHISAWRFLKIGVLVMPPALFLAALASSLFTK